MIHLTTRTHLSTDDVAADRDIVRDGAEADYVQSFAPDLWPDVRRAVAALRQRVDTWEQNVEAAQREEARAARHLSSCLLCRTRPCVAFRVLERSLIEWQRAAQQARTRLDGRTPCP